MKQHCMEDAGQGFIYLPIFHRQLEDLRTCIHRAIVDKFFFVAKIIKVCVCGRRVWRLITHRAARPANRECSLTQL